MKKSIIITKDKSKIYSSREVETIAAMTDLLSPPFPDIEIDAKADILKETEIIFSTWGMPEVDDAFLAKVPRLEALFYAAGSVKGFAAEAMFDRGVRLSSAMEANAVPVAEYSLAMILLALKQALPLIRGGRQSGRWQNTEKNTLQIRGAFQSTVGIVSLGTIGHKVLNLLKAFEVNVAVYCISLTEKRAEELGVRKCTLEEVFKVSDVITLHTAMVPATRGMITAGHILSMKEGASLINTARGGLIDQEGMIGALKKRGDLQVILDVTEPEPPPAGSPILTLDNVFITPHIAGSLRNEYRRLAAYAIDECRRYLAGEPLKWEIKKEQLATMA